MTDAMNETPHPYEEAIDKLRPHISRASDGTFVIDGEMAGTLGIDPIILADLRRSLEQTNEMIMRGEIKSEDVEDA